VHLALETWIGSVAAVLTTVSFAPQAFKVIRSRDTAAISLPMYVLFTLGVGLWFVYGLLIHSAPVCLANGVTLLLASAILAMKIRFG
jgi:MtN3 and saliva related transmembrane protein